MESRNLSPNIFLERQKNVGNIPLLPNTEADLLETKLGLDFGEVKPIKAQLTRWKVSSLTGPMNTFTEKVGLLLHLKKAGAQYLQEFDLVVEYSDKTRPSLRKLHNLHENIHAWIERVNPRYMERAQSNLKAIVNSEETVKNDGPHLKTIVEEYILAKTITEGICNVGRNYVGLKETDTHEDSRNHHQNMTNLEFDGGERDDFFDFDEESFLEELKDLYQDIDLIAKTLSEGDVKAMGKVLEKTSWKYYSLGYKLVLMVAETGAELNLTVGETFKRFLQNPPKKFSDLINIDEIERLKGN